MTVFNSRDIKRFNKNSPLIKIESGYTHVHMITVPKHGYTVPSISSRDKDIANKLRSMAIKASDITKNLSDTMFQHDIPQEACGYFGNECGRIRNLSNSLYKVAAEIGEK